MLGWKRLSREEFKGLNGVLMWKLGPERAKYGDDELGRILLKEMMSKGQSEVGMVRSG